MYKIGIFQGKGGDGKSTIAHGATMAFERQGHTSVCVHTDDSDPIDADQIERERGYLYVDGRDPNVLVEYIDIANSTEEGVMFFDGGANRKEHTMWLAEAMDLVLIPITCEAGVELALDLEKDIMELKNPPIVKFLVNNKPYNNILMKLFVKEVEVDIPKEKTFAYKVPKIDALRHLTSKKPFEKKFINARFRSFLRQFYSEINRTLSEINK